jgi:hypothetical protein
MDEAMGIISKLEPKSRILDLVERWKGLGSLTTRQEWNPGVGTLLAAPPQQPNLPLLRTDIIAVVRRCGRLTGKRQVCSWKKGGGRTSRLFRAFTYISDKRQKWDVFTSCPFRDFLAT